jgi:hypothetical protein
MIEQEFVPYEEAFALKELGFNESCFGYWKSKNWLIQEKTRTDGYTHADQECSAPLYQQAFRWFREKYKLHYSIDYECSQHDHKWGYNYTIYNYSQVVKTNEEYIQSNPIAPAGEWVYETHEEAELECLKKLIELVKPQSHE